VSRRPRSGGKARTRARDSRLSDDLVAANRILAELGVLDGYGHVSVREDRDPERYLLARARAPELVSAEDLVEHDLDSQPLAPESRPLYTERFIHGEIYRVRPDVRAIVHHHAPSVIPFGVGSVPLRPLYHMSAFIGDGVPVFDIREAGGLTDMLVRTPALARALAATLAGRPAALMRGHGAVVVGGSLSQAIGRSVYLEVNARLQLQAILLGGAVTYLDPEEARRAMATLGGYERAWELWRRKALGK
jgi:ribulose-5-phosphate 4-epimerase/fuculose-1-phosphate aldolase